MKLPSACPSCNSKLKVKSLYCENCGTTVDGSYEMPILALLNEKKQDFILEFIKSSGSLKKMSKHLKLSYPTVRNLLDEIINDIKAIETSIK
ncbi:MAG: hypothetical protein DRJ01_05245 [Bacteroidetes bacterium]|nr:MAG: hypothetical protein DRJ01_05245 [Bacteroidota bacterium]